MKNKIDSKPAAQEAPRPAKRKPRGKPFEPQNKHGHGRPKGSLNKRTLIARQLLDENSPAMIKKAQIMALQGNAQVLSTLLSYTLPRPKELPFEIGPLRMADNKQRAETVRRLLKRAFDGEITINQANESIDLLHRGAGMIDALKVAHARAVEDQRMSKRWAAEAEMHSFDGYSDDEPDCGFRSDRKETTEAA
jgi:hypothetical protein